MSQIVAYSKNERGNFVLEVKPAIRYTRKRTTQIAGTDWDEPLPGLFALDPEGNQVPLQANVSIRYSNSYKPGLYVVVPDIAIIANKIREQGNGNGNGHSQAKLIPFRG